MRCFRHRRGRWRDTPRWWTRVWVWPSRYPYSPQIRWGVAKGVPYLMMMMRCILELDTYLIAHLAKPIVDRWRMSKNVMKMAIRTSIPAAAVRERVARVYETIVEVVVRMWTYNASYLVYTGIEEGDLNMYMHRAKKHGWTNCSPDSNLRTHLRYTVLFRQSLTC